MSYRAHKFFFAISHNGEKCENPVLWPWPMTLKFSGCRAVVKIHVPAKFHQDKCTGSWVIHSDLDFGQIDFEREYLWNASTDQVIDKRKTALWSTIFSMFDENNLVNFGPLRENDLDLWSMTLKLNRVVRLSSWVQRFISYRVHKLFCAISQWWKIR